MMVSNDRWTCPLCGHTVVATHTRRNRRQLFLAGARDAHPRTCSKVVVR